MTQERIIAVEPVAGTMLAESKDDARRIRSENIIPWLQGGDTVVLDFKEVGFATQSYMHALISEAIRRYGERSFEKITFRNCTDEVQQVVLTVFEYTMAAVDAAAALPDDSI